ncbi:MAG: S41 family peptidase [Candidatus Pacebacteria bacterium]|nr:S41 family peptidase [Candidatus Paceibacterota bacterium]MDD3729007.1 S41 family peptidase [Candidatus Paceibacterota bacterium]MDD4201622.1 S41 family peptidase [Candidatus Paceibacterota bacterium]MDD5445900.1 S41 family peptidase [Candidatus Paceibacterota bacterium]
MFKFPSYKFKSPFVILFFVFIFGTGFLVGKYSINARPYLSDKADIGLFWEAWDLLERRYIDSQSLDYKKMVYGAISGMIEALEDPPTVFFDPQDAKRFLEDTRGNFEGVGMEISMKNGQLKIVTPLEGTPAEKAGLRAGDIIIKIGEVFASDITVEEAVSLIRGEKGTEIVFTIYRDNWDLPKDFVITRGLIEIPSMRFEIIEKDNLKIAHIKLIHFSLKSSFDFSKIAKEILDSSANGIILDLRNNPGGYFDEAKEIADWFLIKDQIITIQEGKRENIEYRATGNGNLSGYPIVILINYGSASASEILASAIRDNMDAVIVGEQSFGKGSVQELVTLSDGSKIKVTISKWLTPKGNLIDKVGIVPDVVIDMSEEDYEEDKDVYLDTAIEILKDMR